MDIGLGTSLDYKQCFFNGNSIKATQLNSLFTLSINFIKSYNNIIYSQVYNNSFYSENPTLVTLSTFLNCTGSTTGTIIANNTNN